MSPSAKVLDHHDCPRCFRRLEEARKFLRTVPRPHEVLCKPSGAVQEGYTDLRVAFDRFMEMLSHEALDCGKEGPEAPPVLPAKTEAQAFIEELPEQEMPPTDGRYSNHKFLSKQEIEGLKKAWRAGGVMQEDLAKEFGVSVSTVQRYLRGVRRGK